MRPGTAKSASWPRTRARLGYNCEVGGATRQTRRRLPARPSSVPAARHTIREWLVAAGCGDLADDAELAVSEVVTNALVHAGTPVELSMRIDVGFIRVEVADGSAHLPRVRDFHASSGTGRGLKLLEQSVDRWGAELRAQGKVVWFELGERPGSSRPNERSQAREPDADVLVVELLDVPLLLVSAWLEHSGALLREHLLMVLDQGDPGGALGRHAAATEVLALLEEQWPELELGLDPDELLAGAVEPLVTAARLELSVPRSHLSGFGELERLMEDALGPADRGETLTPPTQPEFRALRRWLVRQVEEQARGAAPEPLRIYGEDVGPTRAPVEWDGSGVDTATAALVAADDTDRIVAISQAALALIGHSRDELLGHRLLTIIPARFHQAHLAGFTMHLVNGRGPLLGLPVQVPILRADGAEQPVELLITAQVLPRGRSVFIAELRDVPG